MIETYEEYRARGGKVTSCPTRVCFGWKFLTTHKSTVFSKGRKKVTLNLTGK